MAISKKLLSEGIQNNDFRDDNKVKVEPETRVNSVVNFEENTENSLSKRRVYMTGLKPKGRPKIMEGYGRVRLSLYISEELDNKIEKLLDRNRETKNQLIIRLLEQSCMANKDKRE